VPQHLSMLFRYFQLVVPQRGFCSIALAWRLAPTQGDSGAA
jgi:hypothetical protein